MNIFRKKIDDSIPESIEVNMQMFNLMAACFSISLVGYSLRQLERKRSKKELKSLISSCNVRIKRYSKRVKVYKKQLEIMEQSLNIFTVRHHNYLIKMLSNSEFKLDDALTDKNHFESELESKFDLRKIFKKNKKDKNEK